MAFAEADAMLVQVLHHADGESLSCSLISSQRKMTSRTARPAGIELMRLPHAAAVYKLLPGGR